MLMTLHDAALAMNGRLVGPSADANLAFNRVSTDTRSIQTGDLFIALHGDNFNGEAFVERAFNAGACAAVVTSWQDDLASAQIIVENTTEALGRLAAAWRKLLGAKVVAITGSCGKTSVKGMLRTICEQAGTVHATPKNLNNHIGVPLTLLAANETHDFLVVEAGTSAKGEIAYLSELICADVAVVINVHPAHLQGFGTLAGIAKEKAEIYKHLNRDAQIVINEALLSYEPIAKQLQQSSVLLFTERDDTSLAVSASDERLNELSCAGFKLQLSGKAFEVQLRVPGHHQLENALAAAACSLAMGIDAASIVAGLELYCGEQGRMQISKLGAATLVNDSYNANPASMKAAIDYLSKQELSILVLGDMAELGEDAEHIHREVGKYAALNGVDELLAVGAFADDYCDAYGSKAKHFMNQNELVLYLQQRLSDGPTVLVKGSRSSSMDIVCRALQQEEGQ
ncbi:UDP-N-acetylmuramoyl-tripeptide--D-alanyl-D-alanine ligase [Agaribacterium sp. ZY112]|uniref:UDP-N-acetylmuramoyl-tripeptide--D-alanyl-D- alanine ligase n=1 Tax=Agaribacterium sp. ZY112 TaxID=3233574 RepID=UPI0035243308